MSTAKQKKIITTGTMPAYEVVLVNAIFSSKFHNTSDSSVGKMMVEKDQRWK